MPRLQYYRFSIMQKHAKQVANPCACPVNLKALICVGFHICILTLCKTQFRKPFGTKNVALTFDTDPNANVSYCII